MPTEIAKHHSPAIIGRMFGLARSSHVDSVRYLIQCGEALRAVKDSLGYGEWMLWLKEHQKELGFCDSTARRMMQAAKEWSSTHNLDDDAAAKLNRQIWGNKPPPKIEIEEHSKEYRQLRRMTEWMNAHPAWTVNSSLSRVEAADIRSALTDAREWIVSLERAITALPGSNGRVIENART